MPKKVRDRLLERLQKNEDKKRDLEVEETFTSDHLCEMSSTNSEFSIAMRLPLDEDHPEKALLEQVRYQKWAHLEIKKSENVNEGYSLFTLKPFKMHDIVVEYHGKYVTLEKYIQSTWEEKIVMKQ